MITKILFTALIILAVLVFLRSKGDEGRRQGLERQSRQASDRRTAMIIAITLVLLTLAISGGIFYSHWQESHSLYTVKIINSHSGEEQTYHVYKKDLDGRRFRTIEGRLITISNAERMEVSEGTGLGGWSK